MSRDSHTRRTSQTTPETVAGVLSHEGSVLGPLMRRARHLQRVNRTLRDLVDPAVASHCQVANIDQNTLYLQTESSAWASRLRFLAPTILEKLSEKLGWTGIIHTKVIVRSAHPLERRPTKRSPHLSQKAAALLREVALNTEDPALRKSLLNLSRRGS